MVQGFSFRLSVPLSTTHHKVSRVCSDYWFSDHDDDNYEEYDHDHDDGRYDFRNSLKLSHFVSSCEHHTRSNERGSGLMTMMIMIMVMMMVMLIMMMVMILIIMMMVMNVDDDRDVA